MAIAVSMRLNSRSVLHCSSILCIVAGLLLSAGGAQASPSGFLQKWSSVARHVVLSHWPIGNFPDSDVSVPAEKVKVELYEESLCPYCAHFIQYELSAVVHSSLMEIIDLRLIPYGNARVSPGGTITCQHGPLECVGNLIESCAIHSYPNVSQWYPFIECLTEKRYAIEEEAAGCAESSGLEFGPIKDCYTGPLGDELVRKYGEETDKLVPPHRYVPWLLVDGEPAYDDYDQVAALICKAYKGTAKPKACRRFTENGRKIHTERRFVRGRGRVRGEDVTQVTSCDVTCMHAGM